MLLRYPELDVKDIARFRRILFPLTPSKITSEAIVKTELEAAGFFEELHTRSNTYLKSNFNFYKVHYGVAQAQHPLDADETLLADDDLNHWCKADYWTLQEFAAILVGRKPDILTQFQAGKEKGKCSVADDYLRFFELLKRSQEVGKLRAKSSPSKLLAWASEKKIKLSFSLMTAATTNNAFDEERAHSLTPDGKDTVSCADEYLTSQQKGGLTKQKENLQKIVIVMAKDAYGFDPDAASSPIPTELQGLMGEHGVAMDVGTIRNHLRDAKQLLPASQNLNTAKLVS